MHIYEWNSYSCNNSSSVYLVASFETKERALAMSRELEAFFKEHATQSDKMSQSGDSPCDNHTTPAAVLFGQKYGVHWTEHLRWGDCELLGDEPEIEVSSHFINISHSYSYTFGPHIQEVLKNAGAKWVHEHG